MRVKNEKIMEQKIAWSTITLPLLQGTPVDKDGEIANDETAVGLVMQTYAKKPLMDSIYILVGGYVDESEILYNADGDPKGLSDAAKGSLSGIFLFKEDGDVDKPSGGEGKLYAHVVNIYGLDDEDVPTHTLNATISLILTSDKEIETYADVVSAVSKVGVAPAAGTYFNDADSYEIDFANVTISEYDSDTIYIRGQSDSSGVIGWTGYQVEPENYAAGVFSIHDTVTEI